MKKRMLLVVLAILLVVPFAACSSDPPEVAIVGVWECQDTTQPHQWMCSLAFDANGRFLDRDGDAGDFIIDGDSLTLEFDNFGPIAVTFTLRSNRLTLTGPNLHVVLTRQ